LKTPSRRSLSVSNIGWTTIHKLRWFEVQVPIRWKASRLG
jgi:hypothetical protein